MAMDKFGWHSLLARNFRHLLKMGVRCRTGTMFSIVLSAMQRRDYQFAVEVMEELLETVRSTGSRDRVGISMCMDPLVEACVGAGQWGEVMVGYVLEWYRMMVLGLDQATVDTLLEWLKRYVQMVLWCLVSIW
jgi:hypothetical protein